MIRQDAALPMSCCIVAEHEHSSPTASEPYRLQATQTGSAYAAAI
jgi:hypothetical protein